MEKGARYEGTKVLFRLVDRKVHLVIDYWGSEINNNSFSVM